MRGGTIPLSLNWSKIMIFTEVLLSFAAVFGIGASFVLACKLFMNKVDSGKPTDEAYQETLDELQD